MKETNILHLSDLHFGAEHLEEYPKSAIQKRNDALKTLLIKLENIKPKWKPHIIAISGDIAFSGEKNEFESAWDWIKELLNKLKLKKKSLIICAGNHDKKINKSQRIPKNGLEADKLLERKNLSDLEKNFNGFIDFCKKKKIISLKFDNNKNYLMGSRVLYDINFIILNSAWFARGGKQERKKLFIGNTPIRILKSASQLVDPNNYDKAKITIVLLHHPVGWYDDAEVEGYSNRPPAYYHLARQCHLILSGHTHSERILRATIPVSGGAILFKTGATYKESYYNNNCEILKIFRDSRKVERLKLYYIPIEERWIEELDDHGFYYFLQKTHPNISEIKTRFNKGIILLELKEYDKAIEIFKENIAKL